MKMVFSLLLLEKDNVFVDVPDEMMLTEEGLVSLEHDFGKSAERNLFVLVKSKQMAEECLLI